MMATDVMTLSEYADLLQDLADGWEGEEPAVLVGDMVAESLSITSKDGHTAYGPVGYAHECFEDNGVYELSKVDTRFFGTMLVRTELLADDAQAELMGSGGA